MEAFLQPTHLLFFSVVLIVLGTVVTSALRKTREKELQYHQDLRIREMEHAVIMKQLEIELENAKGRNTGDKAA
jgi:hypothetical protein